MFALSQAAEYIQRAPAIPDGCVTLLDGRTLTVTFRRVVDQTRACAAIAAECTAVWNKGRDPLECACTGLTLERATAGMLVQLGGWLPIVRYEAGSLSAGLDGDGV